MKRSFTCANLFRYSILFFFLLIVSLSNAQPPIPARAVVFGEDEMADIVNGGCTDQNGNAYYTGMYSGTVDFDPGTGVANLSSTSGTDIFVLALGPTGNFLWARSFGSPNTQVGYNVHADDAGNVYVSGWFSDSIDFDPGAGKQMRYSRGLSDPYFLKLDADGNFVWVYTFGNATGDDWGTVAHTDAGGNVYLTGIFTGTVDFDQSPSATHSMSAAGSNDIFIVKVSSAGNFLWAGQIGGPASDNNTGLDIDVSGNVYLSGQVSGSGDLDPGAGIFPVAGTAPVGFVEKLSATGGLIWAKVIVSNVSSLIADVELDQSGHLYCAGNFEGTADFDPGPGIVNGVSNGQSDFFALKLDTAGSYVWVRTIGGDVADAADAMTVDGAGNCYVGGRFRNSVDFDPGPGTATLSSSTASIYFMKLTAAGNYLFAMEIPGTWIRHFGDILVQGPNVQAMGYFSDQVTFGDTVYTSNSVSWDLSPDGFIFTYIQPTEGTLPLTLVNFDVQLVEGHPQLHWVTQQEENVSHFVIERSADGLYYTAIGKELAAGQFHNEYHYTDPQVLSGIAWYRLSSIDRDGKFRHSPVRMVNAGSALTVKVYPVPAKTKLTISTPGNMVTAIELYNTTGALVRKIAAQPAAMQVIDVAGLPAGKYILRISGSQPDYFQQVLIE